VAQHQRRRRVADRQLDLRQAVACPHRAHELAQRQQHVADRPRQDLAAADVGDIARLALVEADQHPPFFATWRTESRARCR
jgi:hypothetical protein